MKTNLRPYVWMGIFAFLLANSVFGSGKPEVKISYDPGKPTKELGPVWLSYCFGRLSYILEHRSEYPKKVTGKWIPCLEEEVDGRFVGLDCYRSLRKKGKIGPDPYWDDVAAVFDAGFQKEYVWMYFHRGSWASEKTPEKLELFKAWRIDHIPDHKPYTNGDIVSERG